MTLNLATNFLGLPFVLRSMVLEQTKLLDGEEIKLLNQASNRDKVMDMYKLAFNRARERGEVTALETKVSELATTYKIKQYA